MRGHGGSEAGEEDAEAAFEFSGTVVGGEDRCEASQPGNSPGYGFHSFAQMTAKVLK
jgi:hypothetical protein